MKRHKSPLEYNRVSVLSNPVKQWCNLFDKDELLNNTTVKPWQVDINSSEVTESIFSYFSRCVPLMIRKKDINGAYKYIINNDDFQEYFGSFFESFLCGDEHNGTFDGLSVYDKPRKYCGKVFAMGDPTYNCKDCALDPTCVFCHECFHNSEHVNHRYKMHASQGSGGYCDCGDEEAWTSNPSCKIHESGFNVENDWDPYEALPENVRYRARFLFIFLLQYSVDMICWEEEDDLPYPLKITEAASSESHIVMLFNDESHTYDEVQKALKAAIKADTQQAFHLAAIVDKDGRSSIFTNTKEKCKKVVEVCKSCLSANGKHPLKCLAPHRDVIAHQLNALSILKWIDGAVNKCSGLRRLHVLLTSNMLCNRDETLVDQVIQMDTEFWKSARVQTHQVFMNALMIDSLGREEFSCSFAKNYQKIIADFIEDDHDHGISVGTMSVQIFTVPSIAKKLMLEYDILEVCFQTFIDHIKHAVGGYGYLDFEVAKVDLRRISYVLYDIRYLLRNKLSLDETIHGKFLSAFKKFVRVLKYMQGMDSVKRKVDVHVEYEPLWERGFDLQIRFSELLGLLASWCSSNGELLRIVLSILLETLFTNDILPFKTVNDKKIVAYDVKQQYVSVHYALSRFIAALVPALSKYNMDLESNLHLAKKKQEREEQLLMLMEYPLRSIILAAQVNAQMWKRNGYAILNQVWWYQSHQCTSEMRDRDILLLQVVASVMEPKIFFFSLLNRFDLVEYFSTTTKSQSSSNEKQMMNYIGTDFFLTLFHIFSERYVSGVGAVASKDIIFREVIHRLSLGPTPRSSLLKKIPSQYICDEIDQSVEKQINELLKVVADYKEPGVTGKGLYKLKKDYLMQCNPFFMHFTKTERSKMQEERRKSLSQTELETNYVANIPSFQKNFQGILNLLWSKELINTLTGLMDMVLHHSKTVSVYAIEQVELALLILAMAFIEVERYKDTDNSQMVNTYSKMIERVHKGSKGNPSLYWMVESLTRKTEEVYHPCAVSVFQLMKNVLSTIGVTNMEIDSANFKVTENNTNEIQSKKEKRQNMAKEQRAKMMAQMNKMQKDFMNKNKYFFSEDSTIESVIDMEVCNPEENVFKIAIGEHQSKPEIRNPKSLCILCQESESNQENNSFVMTCFLQKSKLFVYKDLNDTENKDDCYEAFKPSINRTSNVHISSCGHLVHFKCWEKYYETIKVKETFSNFPIRRHSHLDITDSEYLCPLCKTLCNSVLPLVSVTQHEERNMDVDTTAAAKSINFIEYLRQFLPKDSKINPKELFESPSQQTTTASSFLTQSSFEQATRFFHYIGQNIFTNEHSEKMELFLQSVLSISKLSVLPSNTKSPEAGLPVAWISCSFTLQALECYYREMNKNIFEELSERQMLFLSTLINYLSSSLHCNNKAIKPFAQLTLALLCNDNTDMTILDIDPISLLIGLRFSVIMLSHNHARDSNTSKDELSPKIVDQHVFLLCLRVALVKILLSAPKFDREYADDFEEIKDDTAIECLNIVQSWILVRKAALCYMDDDINADGLKLRNYVVDNLRPFLRCAAIYFSLLNNVQLPDELKTPFAEEDILLLKYLGLQGSVDHIFDPSFIDNEINWESWCSNTKVQKILARKQKIMVQPQVQRLHPLPHNYSDLVNIVSNFKCPTVEDNSRTPCMCLLCGKVLCGQCFCCVSKTNIGSCTKHMEDCSESVGMFIRIRNCEVVLLHKGQKGSILPSPYLDEYGEPDKGLSRGNPLFLNQQRFENLEQLWLKQEIPTTVAKSMESNRSMLVFDWFEF